MALDAQVSSDPVGAQQELSHPQATSAEDANEPPDDPAARAIAPVWLQRLSLFVLVLFCVYLGVLVMVLPWWTRVWDQNNFIQSRPALAALLHSGAMRGLVSGLGLLDIWIGISEAVHYRDHRA
jgi:hypothetical protein